MVIRKRAFLVWEGHIKKNSFVASQFYGIDSLSFYNETRILVKFKKKLDCEKKLDWDLTSFTIFIKKCEGWTRVSAYGTPIKVYFASYLDIRHP